MTDYWKWSRSGTREYEYKELVSLVKFVRHKGGTGDRSCRKCRSWISHWEILSCEIRGKCSRYGCSKAATEGAHVCISRTRNKREWIVLTCSSCNPPYSTDEFRIVKKTRLVTARQCTCRRRGGGQ